MQTEERRRERLPDLRPGLTHHFSIIAKCHKKKCVAGAVADTGEVCSNCDGEGIEEVDAYITTGLYEDGRVGEIFIRVGKTTHDFAMLDQWAIAFSIALQYGAPLVELCTKFRGARFWPDGPTSNDEIKRCSSVVDYVVQWLVKKYIPVEEQS